MARILVSKIKLDLFQNPHTHPQQPLAPYYTWGRGLYCTPCSCCYSLIGCSQHHTHGISAVMNKLKLYSSRKLNYLSVCRFCDGCETKFQDGVSNMAGNPPQHLPPTDWLSAQPTTCIDARDVVSRLCRKAIAVCGACIPGNTTVFKKHNPPTISTRLERDHSLVLRFVIGFHDDWSKMDEITEEHKKYGGFLRIPQLVCGEQHPQTTSTIHYAIIPPTHPTHHRNATIHSLARHTPFSKLC